jgi:ubiquinone/menaquinone biosynthesis C-methylase UbiE
MRQENNYFIDPENAAEMARLLKLDRIITGTLGRPLAELREEDLIQIHDILDIACGPGGWALEIANTYREKRITGIDISGMMIQYANDLAENMGRTNAQFEQMNVLSLPLDFPDASFDLINARLIVGFMKVENWPPFLRECLRILRPGGILRLTECEGGMVGITTSPACEQLNRAGVLALHKNGHCFVPNDALLGNTAVFPSLFRRSGFQEVRHVTFSVDWSAGTAYHQACCQNALIGFRLMKPFLLTHQVLSEEAFEETYQQMKREFQDERFCGMWYFLTVSGTTPGTRR